MSKKSKEREIASEQEYFDAAWECRERMRRLDSQAPAFAVSRAEARQMQREVEDARRRVPGSDVEVAMGRIDTDDGEIHYIGRESIWDHRANLLVSNWRTAVGAMYYEATVADRMGLRRRRRFDTDGNVIVDFEDTVFADLKRSISRLDPGEPSGTDDALLEDLAKARTGELRDIVKTIQATQYRLMRTPIDRLLVVQGGPGTGKTAVALHRVSWLLYNHRDKLAPDRVLVVGPNPTFTSYIRSVLPALGDRDVVELDIASVGATRVAVARQEDDAVAKLKGSPVMHEVIARGIRQRISEPFDDLEFRRRTSRVPQRGGSAGAASTGRSGGRTGASSAWVAARITAEEVAQRLRGLDGATYSAGRQAFRAWMVDEVVRQARVDQSVARDFGIDAVVERIWPQLNAQSFLRDLFGSRQRIMEAAGDDLTAGEAARLVRKPAERVVDEEWSLADLALLDAAEELIGAAPLRMFDHIVVDEAQDLSPMQLRMLGRRSRNGSMTLVGDIAQSTGAWARDDWSEVVAHLPSRLSTTIKELELGYRVPAEVYELAARLLPHAAPGVRPPRVVRHGPPPELIESKVGRLSAAAVRAAAKHASRGHSVGLICPERFYGQMKEELGARRIAWTDTSAGQLSSSINLIMPADAKGLEFDAVVVVEPSAIVDEVERGLRMLYVALTRTTKLLTVVHSGVVLPIPATSSPSGGRRRGSSSGPSAGRKADAAAKELAASIRQTVPEARWSEVLERVANELGIAQGQGAGKGRRG